MTSQTKKAEKAEMIPARVAWDHVDRLDGLNEAFNELACLVAEDEDSHAPALFNLLRDQYLELRETFVKSVGPEGPTAGGEA